jgi:hypothetical protein
MRMARGAERATGRGHVLIVLVALCYSSSYRALTAPPYINAALGVGAALFGVAVSLAYDMYAAPSVRVHMPDARPGGAGA